MKQFVLCLGLMGGGALCGYGSVSAAQALIIDQALDQADGFLKGAFLKEKDDHSRIFTVVGPKYEEKKDEVHTLSTLEVEGKTALMRAVEQRDIERVKRVLASIVFSCEPHEALKAIMAIDSSGKSALSYFKNAASKDGVCKVSQEDDFDVVPRDSSFIPDYSEYMIPQLIIGTVLMLRFGLYDDAAALQEITRSSGADMDFAIEHWKNGFPFLFRRAVEDISRTGKYDEVGCDPRIPLDSSLDNEIFEFLESGRDVSSEAGREFWSNMEEVGKIVTGPQPMAEGDNAAGDSSNSALIEKKGATKGSPKRKGFFGLFGKGK